MRSLGDLIVNHYAHTWSVQRVAWISIDDFDGLHSAVVKRLEVEGEAREKRGKISTEFEGLEVKVFKAYLMCSYSFSVTD